MSQFLAEVALVAAALWPTVLGFATKAALILVATAVIAVALRRHSAATKHLVWTMGTVAVLALPFLTVAAPTWSPPGAAALRPLASSGFDVREFAPVTEPEAAYAPPVAAPLLVGAIPEPAVGPRSVARLAPVASSSVAIASQPAVDPEPVASPIRFQFDLPPSLWMIPVWLLGMVVVLSFVGDGLVRSARLARSARPVRDAYRRDLAIDLARVVGIRRHVRLLEVEGASMPMTWGTLRPVVLLPAESAYWSAPRLRAVLLHELAHVRRCDYLTQLLAQVVCAVHWFNPLAWIAAKRLREERELACDDIVLNGGAKASEYANHLLDVARELRANPLPAVATVCMARRSTLRERLLAVLDATRARSTLRRDTIVPMALGAFALVFPLAGAGVGNQPVERPEPVAVPTPQIAGPAAVAWASAPELAAVPEADVTARRGVLDVVSGLFSKAPAVPSGSQGCDWNTRADHMSASHVTDDDRSEIRIRNGDCRLDIDYRGDITFSDDDTDIASISRGGHFDIEVREGRNVRRLEISAGGGGLVRKWMVNNEEQAYDQAARAWFARMLVVVFRRAGINAEARATRIVAQSGVEGLLREIALIHSDWAAGRYYGVLLSQPNLDPETIRVLVRDAGMRIESDHELGRLLIAVAENQPVDAAVQAAYVEAAGTIDSDYERRRVLSAILKRENISAPLAEAMLRSSQEIGSDFERARLLLEVLEAHPLDDALTQAFFDAARGIESDFEQRRVYSAVLERGAPSVAILDRTLTAAASIGSDHELARLLIQVAEQYPVDASLPASYLRAARSLDSDHERSRVLRTLMARETLSPAVMASVLEAVTSMTSDYELGRILTGLVAGGPLDPSLRDPFFGAVGGIESDHGASTLLRSVIDQQPLDDDLVGRVLAAALQIDSDHSVGQLLIAVAGAHPIGDALRPAFMRAVDTIESEHTRGQVLAALYPRSRPAE